MSESPSFEKWISLVFDRPEDPANMHRAADFWIDDKGRAAGLIEETFVRAADLSPRFSDRQLEAGLWLILSEGYASHAMSETVPVKRRANLLRSTPRLFSSLFSTRCPELDFGGTMPLYRVCYMFWELLAYGKGDPEARSRLIDERFAALESILASDSLMCQYSALHGLGHLHSKANDRTANVIDRYLARHTESGFVLREYALDAREGNVQ